MKFNLDFAISADITPAMVEDIVRKVVEEQTGRKVNRVTFKVREVSDFADRYCRHEFSGCHVTFKTGSPGNE